MRKVIISESMNMFYKILVFLYILFLCIIITANVSLADDFGEITLPGQKCKIKPLDNWTPQEKWVWNQVCEGKIANLNHRFGKGKILNPNNPESWKGNEIRILTPRFLKTILLSESFASSITERGVQIIGALFNDEINLENGNIKCVLTITNSLFKSVNLHHTTFPLLSFSHSTFRGKLKMSSAEIKYLFKCNKSTFYKEVDLKYSKIDLIDMDRSTFNGKLNMNSARIGNLFMRDKAKFFKLVDLGFSKIGLIAMDRSTFNGKLNMNSAKVGNLFMRDGAKFNEVDLKGLKTDLIEMNGSIFKGKLNMNSARIENHLLMDNGAFVNEVDLDAASIGGFLSMNSSSFSGKLGMNSIKVEYSLNMGQGAKFNEVELNNSKIVGFVDMIGSTFNGKLYMKGTKIGNLFKCDESIFHKDVDLAGIVVNGQLSMTGSTFYTKLILNGAKIDDYLFMRNPPNYKIDHANFNEVDLSSSKIGSIDMDRAIFNGKLKMNGVKVENHLFMRKGAKFKEVNLVGTLIGGQLSMTGSTFKGKLNMNGIKIAGPLHMSGCANFNEVNLINANISGDVSMNCSTFNSDLIMDGIKIERRFLFKNAKFNKQDKKMDQPNKFSMIFAVIKGMVDMRGAILTNLDLRRAIIDDELYLSEANYPLTFLPGSELDLRFSEARVLVANPKIKGLKNVGIDGFQYKLLGGFSLGDYDRSSSDNSISFIKEWVYKPEMPLLSAYKQLSRVLINMGLKDQARQVMFKSRYKQMLYDWNNKNFASAIWLTVLGVFIGYGYYLLPTFFWIFALLIIGWRLAIRSKILLPNRKVITNFWYSFDRFWYSFDRLLPIIKLREAHYKVDLDGWGRIYFYVHTMMGYVLTTLILARLSGFLGQL